jgi:transcriptional regulator with XRE-family HTH domain
VNVHVETGRETANGVALGARGSTDDQSISSFDQELGERVRMVRLHRGLSQRELSEAVGVSREHLQNYEKGGTRIHCAALWRIAKALRVRVGDLLENDDYSDPLDAPLNWRERELIALMRRLHDPTLQHAALTFFGAIENTVSSRR